MTKQFKYFLLVVVGLPLALVVLSCMNFLVIRKLLRIENSPLSEIRSHVVPVAVPLVLASSADMNESARTFVQQMFGNNAVARLPSRHPLLIEDSWVRRANPYPPLLADVGAYRSSYFSFGYIGKNGRYCQVTFVSGEADTLPSFLVRKVRGEMTLSGDYFLSYAFFLSREPRLRDVNGRPTYPQIEAIEWGSYRGGSYDGFEEIYGNAAATAIEILILGVAGIAHVRRRRSRLVSGNA